MTDDYVDSKINYIQFNSIQFVYCVKHTYMFIANEQNKTS